MSATLPQTLRSPSLPERPMLRALCRACMIIVVIAGELTLTAPAHSGPSRRTHCLPPSAPRIAMRASPCKFSRILTFIPGGSCGIRSVGTINARYVLVVYRGTAGFALRSQLGFSSLPSFQRSPRGDNAGTKDMSKTPPGDIVAVTKEKSRREISDKNEELRFLKLLERRR